MDGTAYARHAIDALSKKGGFEQDGPNDSWELLTSSIMPSQVRNLIRAPSWISTRSASKSKMSKLL